MCGLWPSPLRRQAGLARCQRLAHFAAPKAYNYLACLAAFRSPRVTAWNPALMLAAVLEAPHLLHSTMVSRVEGSLRRIVSADLHISQVTYSLMYFRKRLSYST